MSARHFAHVLDLPRAPGGYDLVGLYDEEAKQYRTHKLPRRMCLPDDAVRYGEDCAMSVLRRLWPCKDCDARGFFYVQVGFNWETGPEHEPQDCEACEGLGYDESAMPDGFPAKLMPARATGSTS
jgi:hypothetical protein